jgi:PAP2 superfamily
VAPVLRFAEEWPQLIALFLLLSYCVIYISKWGLDRRIERLIAAVSLLIPGLITAYSANQLVNRLRPDKLDLYIYRLDGLLQFEPSFAVGQFVHSLPMFAQVALSLAYNMMPLVVIAIYWASAWRYPEESTIVGRALVLNLALSVPCYFLVPVAGPFYAFPGFPAAPVTGPPHPIRLDALPNGVPSIHFSTALLCAWYSRRFPFGRWLGLLFLTATALATLGFGEHYLFDLVMAVPYSMAVVSMARRLRFSATLPARLPSFDHRAVKRFFSRSTCDSKPIQESDAAPTASTTVRKNIAEPRGARCSAGASRSDTANAGTCRRYNP